MSYYHNKIQAYRLIDEMFKNGNSESKIIFKIQTLFGFSEKMVKERITLIEQNIEGE